MKLKKVSYSITGTVEQGYAQARTSGYPTANLNVRHRMSDIPEGIYCGWARVEGRERIPSVVFYGIPHALPDVTKPRFEVHLLTDSADLYDKELVVDLVAFVRENKKFDDPDALARAIKDDIVTARAFFALD